VDIIVTEIVKEYQIGGGIVIMVAVPVVIFMLVFRHECGPQSVQLHLVGPKTRIFQPNICRFFALVFLRLTFFIVVLK
jgi:hypothetical protein